MPGVSPRWRGPCMGGPPFHPSPGAMIQSRRRSSLAQRESCALAQITWPAESKSLRGSEESFWNEMKEPHGKGEVQNPCLNHLNTWFSKIFFCKIFLGQLFWVCQRVLKRCWISIRLIVFEMLWRIWVPYLTKWLRTHKQPPLSTLMEIYRKVWMGMK